MADHSNLVFVYGALRSGTTILRLMLDGHSRLSCPDESDFMFDHLSVFDGQWCLDVESMRKDWIFAATGMTVPEGSTQEQLAALAEQTRKGQDFGILVLHRGIDKALDLFPGVRIIHLLRDPRDVARSSIPMGWAGNAYCGVDHWISTEETWSGVQDRLQASQVHEVHYEDLVRSPEDTLTGICDFAGVEFDAAMLDYDQRSTYARPDPAKIKQWRALLSQREIGLLEAKLGARLVARGYKASGVPPVRSGALTDLMLRAQSKKKIWAQRFEEFGVVDPIMTSLARRMHLPGIALAAQKRIDSKIVSGLK